MKKEISYRFLSGALSLLLFFSISSPFALLSHCEAMNMEQHEHHVPVAEDCHHDNSVTKLVNDGIDNCDTGITCACGIDRTKVRMEVPVPQKTKITGLLTYEVLAELHSDQPEIQHHPIEVLGSFSPPPIFLTNSSFLN